MFVVHFTPVDEQIPILQLNGLMVTDFEIALPPNGQAVEVGRTRMKLPNSCGLVTRGCQFRLRWTKGDEVEMSSDHRQTTRILFPTRRTLMRIGAHDTTSWIKVVPACTILVNGNIAYKLEFRRPPATLSVSDPDPTATTHHHSTCEIDSGGRDGMKQKKIDHYLSNRTLTASPKQVSRASSSPVARVSRRMQPPKKRVFEEVCFEESESKQVAKISRPFVSTVVNSLVVLPVEAKRVELVDVLQGRCGLTEEEHYVEVPVDPPVKVRSNNTETWDKPAWASRPSGQHHLASVVIVTKCQGLLHCNCVEWYASNMQAMELKTCPHVTMVQGEAVERARLNRIRPYVNRRVCDESNLNIPWSELRGYLEKSIKHSS